MIELIVVALTFLSIPLFMFIAYKRMIGIRDGTQSRLEVDVDPLPAMSPYEELTPGDDGLAYGKAMNFDPHLASADRRGRELPDINQTIQGKR